MLFSPVGQLRFDEQARSPRVALLKYGAVHAHRLMTRSLKVSCPSTTANDASVSPTHLPWPLHGLSTVPTGHDAPSLQSAPS
jgi:hypothetical protein